jgi:hypothetical protein
MYLEFKDEMLIPNINAEVYNQVYELENWFRRICLTAYMKEFGADWINHIPSPFLKSFRGKFNTSQDLLHLDIQGDDNLIWMATHGELMQLLAQSEVSAQVRLLTGFTQTALSQKLDELRYIRNIMAHNRAFSETTLVIVRGLIASLMQGVQFFKRQMLYQVNNDETLMGRLFDDDVEAGFFDNEVSRYLIEREHNYNTRRNQVYIALYKDIYSLISLPVDREGVYPSAARLLEAYKNALEYILAFTLNKTGTEYCVLVPTVTPLDHIKRIINIFMPEPSIWTNTEFEQQNPKYICNPKIWFYENQLPLEE